MRSTKAQAALEFLTTYGWAFLVVLIMIGALAYFGILRPSQLLPEKCEFGKEFACEGYQLMYDNNSDGTATDGVLKFQLRNNAGMSIKIDAINISIDNPNPYNCIMDAVANSFDTKWDDRKTKDFISVDNCDNENAQFSQGQKGKVFVSMVYYKIGAEQFKHTAMGEIYANVK